MNLTALSLLAEELMEACDQVLDPPFECDGDDPQAAEFRAQDEKALSDKIQEMRMFLLNLPAKADVKVEKT